MLRGSTLLHLGSRVKSLLWAHLESREPSLVTSGACSWQAVTDGQCAWALEPATPAPHWPISWARDPLFSFSFITYEGEE